MLAEELGENHKPPAPLGLFAAEKQALRRQGSSWIRRGEVRNDSVRVSTKVCCHSKHGAYEYRIPRNICGEHENMVVLGGHCVPVTSMCGPRGVGEIKAYVSGTTVEQTYERADVEVHRKEIWRFVWAL